MSLIRRLISNLRLNSLDQFRKQSSRLVLEEHSHCEVPAGYLGMQAEFFVIEFRNLKFQPRGGD